MTLNICCLSGSLVKKLNFGAWTSVSQNSVKQNKTKRKWQFDYGSVRLCAMFLFVGPEGSRYRGFNYCCQCHSGDGSLLLSLYSCREASFPVTALLFMLLCCWQVKQFLNMRWSSYSDNKLPQDCFLFSKPAVAWLLVSYISYICNVSDLLQFWLKSSWNLLMSSTDQLIIIIPGVIGSSWDTPSLINLQSAWQINKSHSKTKPTTFMSFER